MSQPKKIPYEEFLALSKEVTVVYDRLNDSDYYYSQQKSKPVNPVFCIEWCTGGMRGGNCWG